MIDWLFDWLIDSNLVILGDTPRTLGFGHILNNEQFTSSRNLVLRWILYFYASISPPSFHPLSVLFTVCLFCFIDNLKTKLHVLNAFRMSVCLTAYGYAICTINFQLGFHWLIWLIDWLIPFFSGYAGHFDYFDHSDHFDYSNYFATHSSTWYSMFTYFLHRYPLFPFFWNTVCFSIFWFLVWGVLFPFGRDRCHNRLFFHKCFESWAKIWISNFCFLITWWINKSALFLRAGNRWNFWNLYELRFWSPKHICTENSLQKT